MTDIRYEYVLASLVAFAMACLVYPLPPGSMDLIDLSNLDNLETRGQVFPQIVNGAARSESAESIFC